MSTFNVETFDLAEYERILSQGLSKGLGVRGNQVCIEAALCQVLGLPHGDDPGCVIESFRQFKIHLNDSSQWISPRTRAFGLKKLGLAQLGSLGVVDEREFTKRLTTDTIKIIIAKLCREILKREDLALGCENNPSRKTALKVKDAAAAAVAAGTYAADNTAYAAYAAANAVNAAANAATNAVNAATNAANAATYAANAATNAATYAESYLVLSADIALKILIDLKSPGCALLEKL